MSGLSAVQVVNHTFDTTYISADLAHYEILHAKVGKGGINNLTEYIMPLYSQRFLTGRALQQDFFTGICSLSGHERQGYKIVMG